MSLDVKAFWCSPLCTLAVDCLFSAWLRGFTLHFYACQWCHMINMLHSVFGSLTFSHQKILACSARLESVEHSRIPHFAPSSARLVSSE